MENFKSPIENSQEKKEKEKIEYIKVFRVRHGDTNYYEHTQEKKLEPGDFDITPKGEEQMREALSKIMSRINKDEDVVCVISSPRIRTKNGKKIIEDGLRENNFLVFDDERMSKPQKRVANIDVYDDAGEVVQVGAENYSALFDQIVSDLEDQAPEGRSLEAHMREVGHEKLESFDDMGKRSRRQLAGFMRIAKRIQPKIDRRIIIIQLEHCETLEDLYENASNGEYTMRKDSGAQKGEVVELDIPVEGDEIRVDFIDKEGSGPRTVKFDYLSKEFHG